MTDASSAAMGHVNTRVCGPSIVVIVPSKRPVGNVASNRPPTSGSKRASSPHQRLSRSAFVSASKTWWGSALIVILASPRTAAWGGLGGGLELDGGGAPGADTARRTSEGLKTLPVGSRGSEESSFARRPRLHPLPPSSRGRSAPADRRRGWKRNGGRAPGLQAEERTQARSGLFLRDLLLFLLLLVLLLGCGCGRGSGGGHRDGRLQGLVDVHALERGGQGLHAGVVDLHARRGEDLLQVLLADGLPGRVQDQRPIDVFHAFSPPVPWMIRITLRAPS